MSRRISNHWRSKFSRFVLIYGGPKTSRQGWMSVHLQFITGLEGGPRLVQHTPWPSCSSRASLASNSHSTKSTSTPRNLRARERESRSPSSETAAAPREDVRAHVREVTASL